MNWFQKAASWAAGKITRPASWVFWGGTAQWTTWNYDSLGRLGYGRNPYQYAAVSLLANSAAGIKLSIRETVGGREQQLDPKSEPAMLLAKPNDLMGPCSLIRWYIGYFLIGGQAFLMGVGPDPDGKRPPRELYPLGPDLMGALPSEEFAFTINAFVYRVKGVDYEMAPATCCWWRSFNPWDPYDGMPAGQVAGRAVDTSTEAFSFNKKLLQSGGVPATVLVTDQKLDKIHRQLLKDEYKKDFGSWINPGGTVAMFDAGLKPDRLGLTPQEMSWDSLLTRCANTIAIVHHLAPELLGDGSHKTYANFQEARAALYTEAVLPLLDDGLEPLSQWLSKRFNAPLRVAYEEDDIEALELMRKDTWARVINAWNANLITLNQAMHELKRPDLGPDGDVYKNDRFPNRSLESLEGLFGSPGKPQDAEEETPPSTGKKLRAIEKKKHGGHWC